MLVARAWTDEMLVTDFCRELGECYFTVTSVARLVAATISEASSHIT